MNNKITVHVASSSTSNMVRVRQKESGITGKKCNGLEVNVRKSLVSKESRLKHGTLGSSSMHRKWLS